MVAEQYIELDNSRFTTMIVDPTIVTLDTKVHCMYCGKILFSMNRKFAIASDGLQPFGGEVPLSVLRVTRLCGNCNHYYVVYFDGQGRDL
jgi:hypothetical protein